MYGFKLILVEELIIESNNFGHLHTCINKIRLPHGNFSSKTSVFIYDWLLCTYNTDMDYN